MARLSEFRRIETRSLRTVAIASLLSALALGAHAQAGALYRCGTNEYTNTLSEAEANGRKCAKLANAEWVSSGSDSAGRQYTYNDRRTVFHDDGTVETWLQVEAPKRADADPADRLRALSLRTVSLQRVSCGAHRVVRRDLRGRHARQLGEQGKQRANGIVPAARSRRRNAGTAAVRRTPRRRAVPGFALTRAMAARASRGISACADAPRRRRQRGRPA